MAGKHGGGSWKVAYADFVTAMMALFLVLWITSQDKKIKEAIELTFKHPFLKGPRQSSGIIPNTVETVRGKSLGGEYQTPSPLEINMLNRLNDDLLKVLATSPEYQQDQTVQLEFTEKGLNINVLNRTQKPVFEKGAAQFTDYGRWVFSTLAWEIARYKRFQVELEGHCPESEKPVADGHDRWDLTADRANAARRVLVNNGVAETQIRSVAGFADTRPVPGAQATDILNSRVTILLVLDPNQNLQAFAP